jgi:hypothetical protein
MSGCVLNEQVSTNERAMWVDGGNATECVGPGIYTNLSTFIDLVQIRNDTMNFVISDPEVATSKSQLVGVEVAVQVRRRTDCDSMRGILTNYPAIRDDDNAVLSLITPSVAEGMKNGVRKFTLDELLSDRNGLSDSIRESLEADANKFYLEVIGLQVKNVALAPEYAKLLQETANLTAQRDLKLKEQDVIKQTAANSQFEQEQRALTLSKQLDAEKKQTEIEVEIATREGKKTEASQKVYAQNSQAFELEKLRLMQKMFSDKTIYFLPMGTDLSLLWGNNSVVPVPAQ